MAAATVNNYAGPRDGSVKQVSWTLTSADATGDSFAFADFADRTWSGSGTWGGATLAFEGSNDGGSTWFPLTNVATGTAGTLTANGGMATIEVPLLARPRLSTAGAGATIAVNVVARRAVK